MFDRGVTTDCPVTFIHPIGGYAFGADSAEFIALKAGRGGKVLALRILPGVDVLENRWAAAKVIFDREGVDVVGVDFTNADPAKAKSIVSDYSPPAAPERPARSRALHLLYPLWARPAGLQPRWLRPELALDLARPPPSATGTVPRSWPAPPGNWRPATARNARTSASM